MKAVQMLIAAAFTAGVVPLAAAQTTLSNANVPTTEPDVGADAAARAGRTDHPVPRMQFVQEPIASASKDDERVKAIVEAMNGDASLKDSKITVQPGENGTITLTGAAMTAEQVKHAGDIAAQQAGEGNVINTILPSELPVAPR